MSRAQELADAHWKYIHQLILEHGAGEAMAQVVGFHYRTAFQHGYKHAQEDAVEAARGALANDAAHKAPSLCDSEVDEWVKRDLCRRCKAQCAFAGEKRNLELCANYHGATNEP